MIRGVQFSKGANFYLRRRLSQSGWPISRKCQAKATIRRKIAPAKAARKYDPSTEWIASKTAIVTNSDYIGKRFVAGWLWILSVYDAKTYRSRSRAWTPSPISFVSPSISNSSSVSRRSLVLVPDTTTFANHPLPSLSTFWISISGPFSRLLISSSSTISEIFSPRVKKSRQTSASSPGGQTRIHDIASCGGERS